MQILHFYRHRRAALYAAYALLSRPAAPEMPRQASNQTDVSPAQRKRMAEVESRLAAGRNPYQKTEDTPTPDKGGLFQDRLEKVAAVVDEDKAFLDRQAAWTEKEKRPHRVVVNIDLRKEAEPLPAWPQIISDGKPIDDPDLRRCSFCYGFVHFKHATVGHSKLEKVNLGDDQVIASKGDLIWLAPKIMHTTSILYACPDCALNLAPITEREK